MTKGATIRYLLGIAGDYEELLSPDEIYAINNAVDIIKETIEIEHSPPWVCRNLSDGKPM